ncbi:MAG: hypothetical protein HC767_15395 [Akkermansiaceae bacterium]|nr:hypothetical protein [Akkermansiaceae bacterium]
MDAVNEAGPDIEDMPSSTQAPSSNHDIPTPTITPELKTKTNSFHH